MSLPAIRSELEGWALYLALLERAPDPDLSRLDRLVAEETAALTVRLATATVSRLPPADQVRRLFRAAGVDPTRYRPSSEALARRVRRDGELPRIGPIVDLNNSLSIRLLLPCCLARDEALEPPIVHRLGRAGEAMDSLRGPFRLEGKPLLADRQGPFGTPIVDSRRVAVQASDRWVLLIVHAPAPLAGRPLVAAAVADLASRSTVARVAEAGWRPPAA